MSNIREAVATDVAALRKLAAGYHEHRDRRERIATAALQGMLADRLTEEPAAVEYAKRAVKFADALIAELDKEAKP